MEEPNQNFIWQNIRKYLINKYSITIIVFAVIIFFVGDRSILNRIKMARRIARQERELRESKERIATMQQQLDALEEPGALEEYAREQYFMHAPDEDVYVVGEE